MTKNQICKELIKVANQLDKNGKYEFANELTKTALEIATIKKAQSQLIQSAPPVTTTPPSQNPPATQTPVNQPAANPQQQAMDAMYQAQPFLRYYQNYDPRFVQQQMNNWQRFNSLGQALQTRNVNEVMKYINDGFAKRQYNRLQNTNNATQALINSIFEVANREYQNLAKFFPGANLPGMQQTGQTQVQQTQMQTQQPQTQMTQQR